VAKTYSKKVVPLDVRRTEDEEIMDKAVLDEIPYKGKTALIMTYDELSVMIRDEKNRLETASYEELAEEKVVTVRNKIKLFKEKI